MKLTYEEPTIVMFAFDGVSTGGLSGSDGDPGDSQPWDAYATGTLYTEHFKAIIDD